MVKKIRKVDLDSFYFMYDNSSDKDGLIKLVCKNNELTYDFVREFKNKITEEDFSESPNLSFELAKSFPELFNYNTWLHSKSQKSISFLENPLVNDDTIISILKTTPSENLDKYLLDKFDNTEFAKYLLRSKYVTIEYLKNNSDAVVSNNELISNPFLPKLSNNDIEEIIKKSKVCNPGFILSVLEKSDDTAWIKRMISELSDIKITNTTDENVEPKIFNILDKIESKNVMEELLSWVSDNRVNLDWKPSRKFILYILYSLDVNESTVNIFIDDIKSSQDNLLIKKVIDYAKEFNYTSVLLALCV